jgi:hypothetical protein
MVGIARYINRTTMDTISLLKKYGEDVGAGSVEQTLAFVAARWIAADPTAISDPLLTDLLARAQFHTGSSQTSIADSFLFGTKRKGSIMEYFGVATIPNTSLPESLPAIASARARIYCDGACTANGRKGAKAGYGGLLVKSDGTEETVSEALAPTESQTNQRAELKGLQYTWLAQIRRERRLASGYSEADVGNLET